MTIDSLDIAKQSAIETAVEKELNPITAKRGLAGAALKLLVLVGYGNLDSYEDSIRDRVTRHLDEVAPSEKK